ncbi:phage tail sheath C-terminal domain-containing protein [Variovorax rhizosphaerae]|uniref:Phage tail sheath C-terminal domain-containing protein n=1 Tax=Variovorax rhizosphaerae TaxID=1836200 RepID=A0ABU8WQ41_9BURK
MSEVISEMIEPGTYIEVRSEGLIGVGGISTGNLGVVGTANRGPVGTAVILGSLGEAIDTFGSYDRFPGTAEAPALTLVRTLEQVFKGGGSTVYAVRVANLAADAQMKSMTWSVNAAASALLFTLTATSPGTWANAIAAAFTAATSAKPAELTLTLGRLKESFTGADAGALFDAIKDGSRLVVPTGLAATSRGTAVAAVVAASGADLGGPDGVAATTTELAAGLAVLATQPVNIVVAGGFDAKTGAGTMLAHLEETENDGRERIAVMGASSDVPATLAADDVSKASNPRFVLVAPGILADDAARAGEANKQVKLPAAYAAALVAGRLATLAPHISLTNKDVAADGLTREYTRAERKNLLGNRVLVLNKSFGFRVLKGNSTDTGAFKQISVRRIVDYAKAGVRVGSNPYIGRLNNSRVRAALKATLDGFLSGMVLDEMLVGYTLDVSATRAQEINGQAIVTMTLMPTFSIDFIKVIMNLS